jgi:hypothetical protein
MYKNLLVYVSKDMISVAVAAKDEESLSYMVIFQIILNPFVD